MYNEYDQRNNKMMGKDMRYTDHDDGFFPKEAKMMKMKCPSDIDNSFKYPDTQESIYRFQEDNVKKAKRDLDKGERIG